MSNDFDFLWLGTLEALWLLLELRLLKVFFSQHVDCFVVGDTEGFVAVGIGDSAAGGFAWSGAGGFRGTFLAYFVDCHPSLLLHVLLHFCKWGDVVSISIFSVVCLGIVMV